MLVLARGCRASAACWLAEPASGPRSRLAWLLGPRPCAIPIGNWNSQYRRSRAGARSRTVIGTGHVALAALARPRRSALFFAHGHANLLYDTPRELAVAREISPYPVPAPDNAAGAPRPPRSLKRGRSAMCSRRTPQIAQPTSARYSTPTRAPAHTHIVLSPR